MKTAGNTVNEIVPQTSELGSHDVLKRAVWRLKTSKKRSNSIYKTPGQLAF